MNHFHAVAGLFRLFLKSFERRRLPSQKNVAVVGQPAHALQVSYDVSSLYNHVHLEETLQILVDKAFVKNWFNRTRHLNLSSMHLVDLIRVSTKDQLIQLNGQLYEHTDGVAMGAPLGPLLANVRYGSIEETLVYEGKMPSFYKRCVNDTFNFSA